ncbi:hypothetical protein F3Y22_tig00110372pilonHSYRG00275 [Hibiscus syriacus]|uniref:Cyclin-like domain-containing protein n=1 Tax=Hibiscus syriacus TaxID=106335 RepID=A0A6A3AU97_HIBSY|nr:hypothetical protein F3Y22_tig00110372pilonHSYRG00275 [Hibiscus syriacus]
MVFCSSCSRNVAGERLNEGVLCCNFCGKVLEEYNYATEPQFVKDSAGQSKLSGNFVKSVQDISDSRRRTLDKAFDNMNSLRIQLELDDYSDEVVEIARRFYEIGLERNFTRGRRSELVEAACLYLACRQKRKPFLLIDFSNSISVNVYELGSVYLQLCYVLYLADTKDLPKLVDPSIFIHKFTNTLIPEGNDAVVKTARDILASMKRDWMQTGRKPSGLCGAALYISALSHGLKVSKSKIIEVVHICEATLSKRLIEFENTDAGALTMEEFTEKERELRNSSLTIKQPNTGSKETSLDEVLCRHTERKPFAYGLCNECYEEFMKVSGGLEGDQIHLHSNVLRKRDLQNYLWRKILIAYITALLGVDLKKLKILDFWRTQLTRQPLMTVTIINYLVLMVVMMDQITFLILMILRSMVIFFTMRRRSISKRSFGKK